MVRRPVGEQPLVVQGLTVRRRRAGLVAHGDGPGGPDRPASASLGPALLVHGARLRTRPDPTGPNRERAARLVGGVEVDERVEPGFQDALAAHLPAMWWLARRYAGGAAEDLVQEALEQAWRRRDSYDPARGSLRTWLLVLVADRCRKHARAARPTAELPDVAAPVRDGDLPVDLGRAVASLPPRQRLAVELFYVVGLPVAECAEVMGCAAGTVKSTLSDARARLRPLLEVSG